MGRALLRNGTSDGHLPIRDCAFLSKDGELVAYVAAGVSLDEAEAATRAELPEDPSAPQREPAPRATAVPPRRRARALVDGGPPIERPEDPRTLPEALVRAARTAVRSSIVYTGGAEIDWAGVPRDGTHRRVLLPTYPFQRQRHWMDVPSGGAP